MCNSSGAYGGMQTKPMSMGNQNAFGQNAFSSGGFAADNTSVANGQSALGGMNDPFKNAPQDILSRGGGSTSYIPNDASYQFSMQNSPYTMANFQGQSGRGGGNPFNQGGGMAMQYGPPRGMGGGMGEGQFQPPPGMAQGMGPNEGRFQPPLGMPPPQGMREAAFNPQNYPGQPMSQAGVNPYNVVPMNSGLHPLQRPYYQGR